jgi:hypothetical protein
MGHYCVRTSIYSQFSEVKFSSVALADVGQSEKQVGLGRRTLTDDIVEGILLSPKHCTTGRKGGMRDQVKYGMCKA